MSPRLSKYKFLFIDRVNIDTNLQLTVQKKVLSHIDKYEDRSPCGKLYRTHDKCDLLPCFPAVKFSRLEKKLKFRMEYIFGP